MKKATKKMKLTFHYDGGHGWLAVKRSFIKELGIEKEITGYSYQRGETVYLEEDADVSTFVKAMEAKHGLSWATIKEELLEIKSSYKERSPIRNYAPYCLNRVTEFKVGMKIMIYGKKYEVIGEKGEFRSRTAVRDEMGRVFGLRRIDEEHAKLIVEEPTQDGTWA